MFILLNLIPIAERIYVLIVYYYNFNLILWWCILYSIYAVIIHLILLNFLGNTDVTLYNKEDIYLLDLIGVEKLLIAI